jgi:undecaprenyl-diphosphatase
MTLWEAAVLGLIQGLTEFLPVSSSGHLVLAQYLLGMDAQQASDVTFEVFVHFGTMLSILTVYWKQVWMIIRETFVAAVAPADLPGAYRRNEHFRTGVLILLTMVPTGIVYWRFQAGLEAAFNNPRLVLVMLLVTGTLLLLTVLRREHDGEMGVVKAAVVGCAQAAAMIPGISRSGATICTALYQNVRRERAANFSFLMLLPVVFGATILKIGELLEVQLPMDQWFPLAVGTVVAYISGVFAIYVMLDFVTRGKLQYFAYYCFLVGGTGLVLL